MIRIIEYQAKYKDEIRDFIENLVVTEFNVHRERRTDLDNIPEVYIKPTGNFWIVVDDHDKIVGTLGLQKLNHDIAYLRRFYIDRTYRGTGLAQQLLERLLALARENKYRKLFLDTSVKMTRAHHFYEKNRFYRTNEIPPHLNLPYVQDQYLYEKKL